jgi:putative oxidoreductase
MMKMLKCECAKNWGDIAPLVLRVVAGTIFLMHGLQKMSGDVSMFGKMLGTMSVPAPIFLAWAVILLEIIGGLALIVGFMTHWVSKLLTLLMLVAIFLVHINKGFFVQNGGYEFALLLLVSAISLMITGAGKWSVDEWLLKSCCGKCVDGVCPDHRGSTVVK